MQTQITHKRTIESIKRMKNSRNGNPRFRFTFTDGIVLYSLPDRSWSYEIGNRGMREGATVEFTLSRGGRIDMMRAAS